MRDSKLLMHAGTLPTASSAAVDSNNPQPGIGTPAFYSATITGHTATAPVAVELRTSDTGDSGTFSVAAKYTIPIDIATAGNVIISTPIPTTAGRYITSVWTGLTGGNLVDGIDWGLKDGKAATQPFLA